MATDGLAVPYLKQVACPLPPATRPPALPPPLCGNMGGCPRPEPCRPGKYAAMPCDMRGTLDPAANYEVLYQMRLICSKDAGRDSGQSFGPSLPEVLTFLGNMLLRSRKRMCFTLRVKVRIGALSQSMYSG